MSRCRNWCFTLNNADGLLDPDQWPRATYCIYSEEVGDSGTYHLQGYVEFSAALPLSSLKRLPQLETAHWEPRRGTQAQAIAYCQKTDDSTFVGGPYVWGVPKAQGARSDLSAIAADLRDGVSVKRVAEEHPADFMRYSTGILRFAAVTMPKRGDAEGTACFVFFGAGGCGKTSFALRLARYLGNVFRLPEEKGSGLYWDGYQQGDVVIIDEFKGSRMRPTFFNGLIDKGPFQVPVHGGTMEFRSRLVIVTTNVHPREWWPKVQFQHSLRRRITMWPIFRRLDGPDWRTYVPRSSVVYDPVAGQFIHR